jgi:Ca2+-binding RTX toxin-like protein
MAGSVTLLPWGLITVVPDANLSRNTAIVSYQTIGGSAQVDVNLNGSDHYFNTTQALMVAYLGSGISGTQAFQNTTDLTTVAFGGSGNNTFIGGAGTDEFVGGSGANTFEAGIGYDILVGGSGSNTYYESQTGSGLIIELGTSNAVNTPPGATGSYLVF